MDRVIPMCESMGGFALSVANEPQFYFEDFEADPSDFIAFYQEVTDHIHTLSDSVAVTITLANHELTLESNMQMLAISDVVVCCLHLDNSLRKVLTLTPGSDAEPVWSPHNRPRLRLD